MKNAIKTFPKWKINITVFITQPLGFIWMQTCLSKMAEKNSDFVEFGN